MQNVPEHVMKNQFKEFFLFYFVLFVGMNKKKRNDGGNREETPEKKKKYYSINMDKLIRAVFFFSFACNKLNAFMPFTQFNFIP